MYAKSPKIVKVKLLAFKNNGKKTTVDTPSRRHFYSTSYPSTTGKSLVSNSITFGPKKQLDLVAN
jgi:hypothetical protein